MNRRLLALLAVGLAAALLIGACGGGDGDDDGGAPDGAIGTSTPTEDTRIVVELQWWGQAMFVLRTPAGNTIVMDPYNSGIGYELPDQMTADVVTASHEHFDHNNVALGGESATILRGLTDDGWAEIDERPASDVAVRTVPTWHDESEGSERGRNAIFVVETGGLRIVHLGDLGHTLSPEQIAAIGPVDVLLVPVGGFFTIDAAGAREVVEQLAPRVVIPMHYKTKASTISQLRPVQPFLDGKEAEQRGPTVELDDRELPPPGSAVVWVLEPAGAR